MPRPRTRLSLPVVGLLFVVLLGAGAPPARAQTTTKNPVVTAENYRKELQDILAQLRRMEKHRPRVVAPLLGRLEKKVDVKRADGAVQTLSDEEWYRRGLELNVKPPAGKKPSSVKVVPGVDDAGKDLTTRLRQIVEGRLHALDQWAPAGAKSYYTEADAQTIISQLESNGSIRTGPTWLQLQWQSFNQMLSNAFQGFLNWLRGITPTPAPRPPNMDFRWVQYLFYALVVALLAAILLFIWRAIGGKWRRNAARNEVDLHGEDAELLLLPPDELRDRASRFAAEGNFREALRHRYLSLLLTLDSRGVWRHDVRRTNWEHIGLLRRSEQYRPLVAPLSDITRRFDRVRYGGAACSAEEWERFNADCSEVESRTGQGVRV